MIDDALFVTQLARSSSWRKKELMTLATSLDTEASAFRFVAMRAATVLFCAHCEGFLKDALTLFLRTLEVAGLQLSQLREVYVILLCPDGVVRNWGQVKTALLSSRTRSPLESSELRRLMWTLGMNYGQLANKEIPLANLRNLRNRIAHGERVYVGPERYAELARTSVDFIEAIEFEFSSAVMGRRFMRPLQNGVTRGVTRDTS